LSYDSVVTVQMRWRMCRWFPSSTRMTAVLQAGAGSTPAGRRRWQRAQVGGGGRCAASRMNSSITSGSRRSSSSWSSAAASHSSVSQQQRHLLSLITACRDLYQT